MVFFFPKCIPICRERLDVSLHFQGNDSLLRFTPKEVEVHVVLMIFNLSMLHVADGTGMQRPYVKPFTWILLKTQVKTPLIYTYT